MPGFDCCRVESIFIFRMFRNYLVVSSSAKTRDNLAGAFRARGSTVTLASTGSEALLVAKNVSIDTAVVDTFVSDMRAEVLRKQIRATRPDCRVLMLTPFSVVKGTTDLLRLGDDDFLLRKPDLLEILESASEGEAVARTTPVHDKTKSSLIEVIDVLVGLIELGDRYFGGSSHQAMRLARAVAEEMSSESETLDEVAIAALLRDIGKAGVTRDVLSNEGQLSDAQVREMQGHVHSGVRLLEHIDFPWKVVPIIRHHHERYDGRGYPDGLRGREIPIGSRILSVVDAFIAMVSDRPHRPAMRQQEAFEELIRHAGSQFDPEVVEVFISVMEKKSPARSMRDRFRVVIADPSEDFRNLLRLRLINENFEVETVATNVEALEAIVERGADLVIADARPGSSDTIQFFRELREDEKLRNVPFIFLSEREDRVLKVRALRLGVDDFVVKNLDLEEIMARIENVLTRETMRREAPGARRRRGISGRLENMSLPDIIQTLHIGMKTALVTLSDGKKSGKIWFDQGAITHAETDGAQGDAAFYAMLRWNSGEFSIEHGVSGKIRTVDVDPMFLLMEGLRLLDEEGDPARVGAAETPA
jgi:response regulator RpfG family c-di-GMP phosphodiesterase